MLIDLIPTTGAAFTVATLSFRMTHQKDESKRYWLFLLSHILSHHLVESVAYLLTFSIPNTDLRLLTSFSIIVSSNLYSGYVINFNDIPKSLNVLNPLSTIKFIYSPMLVAIYGFDRCPKNMTSKTLYEFDINDDTYGEYTGYAITQLVCFRLIAICVLLFITNRRYYHNINNYIKVKFFGSYITRRVNSAFNPICYDNPVTIDIESEESETDNNESSNQSDTETSSLYCSVFSNDSELYDKEESDHGLSIGWLDLTLKVEKTFYSTEKLILRGIKGYVRFGALTALMGPTGAGKTSLLRSLNGLYKTLMTKESKIFLSNSRKIRTCFIAQNQKEHIINGLSVYQTLLYASKLKNIGYSVDHELNIKKLMNELLIFDIRNRSVHKCSAGQQKRIVMAMELTAKVKPNLICVDEPTSGVDSYSALLV